MPSPSRSATNIPWNAIGPSESVPVWRYTWSFCSRNTSVFAFRSSRTTSLRPSPSVSKRGHADNLGRAAVGVVLILVVPAAGLVEKQVARNKFCVTINAGPSRSVT